MVDKIVKRVKGFYTKNDFVGFSSRIYASKCASCIQHDKMYNAYVGGPAPDHFFKYQSTKKTTKNNNSEEEIVNMFTGYDATNNLPQK